MDNNSPDAQLMLDIQSKWGLLIASACGKTVISDSFLAALVANESGGDPNAKRFEAAEFSSILLVAAGKKAEFTAGGLGALDLMKYLSPSGLVPLSTGLQRAADLATSFGLAQIMGWQALKRGISLDGLPIPARNLFLAADILSDFMRQFKLTKFDAEGLFRCWNGGSPHAPTFDPNYVSNGLARMALYAQIVATPVAAPAGKVQ